MLRALFVCWKYVDIISTTWLHLTLFSRGSWRARERRFGEFHGNSGFAVGLLPVIASDCLAVADVLVKLHVDALKHIESGPLHQMASQEWGTPRNHWYIDIILVS